jgi:hypothetical protein
MALHLMCNAIDVEFYSMLCNKSLNDMNMFVFVNQHDYLHVRVIVLILFLITMHMEI